MAEGELKAWLESYKPGGGFRLEALGGGCINRTSRLIFDDGGSLVVKQNPSAPEDMFRAEATGLEQLAAVLAPRPSGPQVPPSSEPQQQSLGIPAVHGFGPHFIVLEDLGQGHPAAGFWEALGAGLARLHSIESPRFGFPADNYCGITRQANPLTADGHEFFAEHRLLALGKCCGERGLLERRDMERLEYIASHLRRWIPEQPAVLIHGDLWSGNIHCCDNGQPALIDPAAYWGWAEADLAMTQLFGGFAPAFYRSYGEAAASRPGWKPDWEERCGLYNLYHLLNHLLLFGSSYLGQVRDVLGRYRD